MEPGSGTAVFRMSVLRAVPGVPTARGSVVIEQDDGAGNDCRYVAHRPHDIGDAADAAAGSTTAACGAAARDAAAAAPGSAAAAGSARSAAD